MGKEGRVGREGNSWAQVVSQKCYLLLKILETAFNKDTHRTNNRPVLLRKIYFYQENELLLLD